VIRIAVCVPVRDEEARLPAMVAALRDQRDVSDCHVTLCCFFDGCRDGSEAVVVGAAGDLPVRAGRDVRHPEPNAGRARAAAVAIGLKEVGADGLILSTDADSVPAADWIAQAVRALAGCDVVAGMIERDGPFDAAQNRLEDYYDRLHALRRRIDPVHWDPAPGHHHTGGANLAFSVAAYRAAGGFQALPSGEDARFVDDAARAGLRVRRDRSVRVQTSARREGRAPGGLAVQLRQGDAGGWAALRVGDPHAAVWQYRQHAAARAGFAVLPARAEELGRPLGLSADHVVGVARDCPNGEAFATRIVPAPPGAGLTLSLAEAERGLARLEAERLECAA
jgi:hypothetical protein